MQTPKKPRPPAPVDWTLTTLSVPEWKAFERSGRAALDGAIEAKLATREQLRRDRAFLCSDCNLGRLYRATYFALLVDGRPVAVNIAYQGKLERGDWGRYLTIHFLYTLYGMRGRGYDGALMRKVEEYAREHGFRRLRSLAGTYGGFRLHLSAGHVFWGPEPLGLRVDAPLAPWLGPQSFPAGVPPGAASCGAQRPATGAQLLGWVTDPKGKFRGEPAATQAALLRHGFAVEG